MGLLEPQFVKEGWDYIGEDGEWHLKPDAPDWAKIEFETFKKMVNPEPDENGIIIEY